MTQHDTALGRGSATRGPRLRRRPRVTMLSALPVVPARGLVIDTPGSSIGKTSERLRIQVPGCETTDHAVLDLDYVIVGTRGVSMSSDALMLCAERDIPISLLSPQDELIVTLISSAPGATVQTRRAQLTAFTDSRGAVLAAAFTYGKLMNQARLLRYMAKNRRTRDPQAHMIAAAAALRIDGLARLAARQQGVDASSVRQDLMTLEGQGGALYWSAVRSLVRVSDDWPGRATRGARDVTNSALNYGYKILYTVVQQAVLLAGLDPFGGFLHADRPGKPSLVLDLVEEFRQTIVDRSLFALLNKGVSLSVEDGWLTADSRRALIDRIAARLQTSEPYETGHRATLQAIVRTQAVRLAAFLRGERAAYWPYLGRW